MRKTSLCLCLIWFLPATTLVHGGARDDPPPKNRAATLQAYIVRLTEIRLSDLLDQNLSAKEVLKSLEQMKKEGKVEMMETVQLSVLDENDSVAQFQRSVPVANWADIRWSTGIPNSELLIHPGRNKGAAGRAITGGSGDAGDRV